MTTSPIEKTTRPRRDITVNATPKKKLIETSLPLERINFESAREKKSIRKGHPLMIHLYWARRPLAAARAVLWAQLVDDPSARPDEFPTKESQDNERARLLGILEQLVVWENLSDQDLLNQAREEIRKSNDGVLPAVLDPFAGGGTIPLEAPEPSFGADQQVSNRDSASICGATTRQSPFVGQNDYVARRARPGGRREALWQPTPGEGPPADR
jgi:putative DNA methylase